MNVDPNNPSNAPSVAELQQAHVRWVRLVSRNDDVVRTYIQNCWAAGIMVLAVITDQSHGYVCPADVYQIGNEPDIPGTNDSMSPAAYVVYWNIYRQTYPDLVMIGAGLGSGQTSYWSQVQLSGGLANASGFAVHPYSKTTAQAKTLLAAYQKITPSLPIWATEVNRSTGELPGFIQMLRQSTVMWAWFCWSADVAIQQNIWPLTTSMQRVLGSLV